MKIKEIEAPSMPKGLSDVKAYVTDTNCQILYSVDHTPKFGKLKHISISAKDRHPSWEEILTAKVILLGNIDAMMVMPKYKDYINVHKHCFHVWETPSGWNMQ